MKRFIPFLMIAFAMLTMGCSERVPTGFKGKVVTANGPQADILNPGNHTCFFRDRMYLIDASTVVSTEKMNILTQDKINITVDIHVRATPNLNTKNFNYLMDKMGSKFKQSTTSQYVLNSHSIYTTFIAPEIRPLSRSVINKYPINEVADNRDKIGAEIEALIKKTMANLPIKIEMVRLSNVDFPAVITNAKEKAMERKEAIEREKADMAVALLKLENRKKIAEKKKIVRAKEAEAERIYNQIIGSGLTDRYLRLREIDNQAVLNERVGAGDKVIFNAPAGGIYNVGGK